MVIKFLMAIALVARVHSQEGTFSRILKINKFRNYEFGAFRQNCDFTSGKK